MRAIIAIEEGELSDSETAGLEIEKWREIEYKNGDSCT